MSLLSALSISLDSTFKWTFEEIALKFCIISDKNSLRLSATKSRFNIHKGAQAFFGVVPFNIV